MSLKYNRVRIIGGKWRGRKIVFSDGEHLRPTPDRVRETLFNWLAPHIINAHCLDLFAGSGILGFEALSRGAGYVLALEQNHQAFQNIQKNAETLHIQTSELKVTMIDSLSWLKQSSKQAGPFDILFLDPPYQSTLLLLSLSELVKNHLLKPNALLYLEMNAPLNPKTLPLEIKILKEKKAGMVFYYLATYTP